jgi:hypothetical protein
MTNGLDLFMESKSSATGMVPLGLAEVSKLQSEPPFGMSDAKELSPGQEVVVPVKLRDLPRSITVKRIRADITIRPTQSTNAGQPVTQKSTVKEAQGSSRSLEVTIAPPLGPSSLDVRFEGGASFWNFSNLPMMIGTHDLPDFADYVNTHLDGISGSDAILTFLVKADGPGTATIRVKSLDYTVIQTQTWPGPGGGAVRRDRDFTVSLGEVTTVPLDAPSDQIGNRHSLAVVSLDIRGELGPERLLPDIIMPDRQQFVTVSTEYSIAQELSIPAETFQSKKPIEVVGVVCSFLAETEGQIHVALHPDASGMPTESSPIAHAASVVVSVDKSKTSAVTFIQFDRPVSIQIETTYWVVFKGIQGSIQLGLSSSQHSYIKAILTNRGGQYWKSLERNDLEHKTATHLVYVPGAEHQIPPIELLLDDMPVPFAVKVGTTVDTVQLSVPQTRSTGGVTNLTIRSRAQGRFNISNVTQEYLPVDGTVTLNMLINKGATIKMLRGVKIL